jgi:alanyl-tRNA synthetase
VKATEIRQSFLRYFEERDHRVVPSATLVPEADPTLLFVNAGMVPFKRVFLGEEARDYTRATSSQKCMRVSGKHSDLENVGRTPRHHTFFEMLGNFSFGDYFKEGAIEYAWDFLTRVCGIEESRMVISVFRDDDEAYTIWRDRMGVPENRIFRLGESENFWQMADTGPCGPCSEIHLIVDESAFRGGADPSQEGYVEIWNLVFMQYEQAADGERKPLPKPSIDTGMGLDRLATILQGVSSNYENDLFRPLIEETSELSGQRSGVDPQKDVSLNVVADHARACTFMIGDGVLPSSEGRGYVLRRVLRRAARHGVLLGLEEPFLHRIAGKVVDVMGDAYPEIVERRPFIEETIRREEERFLRTLGRGLALLDEEIARVRKERARRLSGQVVFRLYDTYGFPVDLTEDILSGHELDYDRETFESCMREQSERARAAWRGSGQTAPLELYGEIGQQGETRFLGYDTVEARSAVRALIVDGARVEEAAEGTRVAVVVEATPFYAESGGQVGDVGSIAFPDGFVEVEDTRKPVEGLTVHYGRVTRGCVRTGVEVGLEVDREKRLATVRNHSATHLLHWALRELLGPQCRQAGSLVAPDRLRFDFSHDAALTDEELRQLEDRVNEKILENHSASISEKGYQDALRDGAIAIFEESYGDVVRVVRFGEFSTELCGGTHAAATGDIGSFRIVSQSSVGAGMRRLEAVTGHGAIDWARRESHLLRDVAGALRTSPADLGERVHKLLERERELERELEKTRAQMRRGGAADPMQNLREVDGVKVVAAEVEDANPKELRSLVDDLKRRVGSGVVLLGSHQEGKVALALGVTRDLTDRLRAGDLVKQIATEVGGSGGGRPDFAQAGGSDADRLPAALDRLYDLVATEARTK